MPVESREGEKKKEEFESYGQVRTLCTYSSSVSFYTCMSTYCRVQVLSIVCTCTWCHGKRYVPVLFVAVKIASFGLNHTCTVTESHLYCTRSVV